MRPLAQKAVGMMKAQGLIRVVNHDLIDRTLREIGREYKPGLIQWLKSQPDRWSRLLQVENRINRAALTGNKEGLTAALADYRAFFKEMVNLHVSTGEQGELFTPGDVAP